MLCINDFVVNFVAQLILQRFANDFEGFALLMAEKILDVFQHKRSWTMVSNDSCDFKEQCSLRLALESVRRAERIFL